MRNDGSNDSLKNLEMQLGLELLKQFMTKPQWQVAFWQMDIGERCCANYDGTLR